MNSTRTLLALIVVVGGCGGPARSSGSGGNPDAGGPSVGPGGGPDCWRCSADLHQVLDCDGNIIETCPLDQGCGGLGCVPACESAKRNKSSVGCDYWAVTPDVFSYIEEFIPPMGEGGGNNGSCFAAFVVNTWGTDMKVGLEWKGQTLDAIPFAYLPLGTSQAPTYQPLPSSGIPPNSVAIVFLADLAGEEVTDKPRQGKPIDCPQLAAITGEDTGVHGTGRFHAIGLQTSVPAVVYDIYPFGGARSYVSSATLLLPTSTWDKNYVAASSFRGIAPTNPMSLGEPANLDIVAFEDQTSVTIAPTADIVARSTPRFGTVEGTGKGQPKTYTLNRGEVLQVVQLEDLSGSPILANKPIGVWGGHWCMRFGTDWASTGPPPFACDGGHQQLPPVQALGSEYVAAHHRSRSSSSGPELQLWRIVGAVDGTTLTYDPPGNLVSSPSGTAPSAIAKGQVAGFLSSGPLRITSQDAQHPFYLAQQMTGGGAGDFLRTGDPETVNVLPPQQFLSKYVFFTDPTYRETNLVVIRSKKSGGAFKDVKLDCYGALGGWQPVDSAGDYEFTRADLQIGRMPVGACDNGRHTIESAAPFGLVVWGFDDYVSYAYPAGASVQPINTVVVPPW